MIFYKNGLSTPWNAKANNQKALWRCLLCLGGIALALLYTQSSFSAVSTALIDRIEAQYGQRAKLRVNAWYQLIDDAREQNWSERRSLEEVNIFFNQLNFIDDLKLWRKVDYWATPLEFLGAAGGDCEDFTIAKYYSLLKLGVADNKLRLVYVKALRYNQFHMVLAYYEHPESVPMILDNLDPEIRRATERRDLAPVYSFNGRHLWVMRTRGQGVAAGSSGRLGLWNDLQQRVNKGRLMRPAINLDN